MACTLRDRSKEARFSNKLRRFTLLLPIHNIPIPVAPEKKQNKTNNNMSSNRRPLRQFDNEGSFGFKNKFFHFQGETLDGKPHGPGLLRLSNGVTVQGEFVKGELKGPGTKRWPDGGIFYGTFENGEPHGFGRHFSVQTLQDFEGFYERGYKKGYGKLTDHAQGTVFEGEFLRDFPNGKGVLKAIGGDLVSPLCVKGYWENAKLHGLAMATLSNGDTAVGVCEDGLWTGNGAFATLATRYSLPPVPNSSTNILKADVVSLNGSADTNGNLSQASLISTPLPPPQGAASACVGEAAVGANGSFNVATHDANNVLVAAASFLGVRSAIRFKGPMEHGCRAEVPDALKLRSAVLLCNRAPLERIDPDTPPGDGGLFLWGTKPPRSPLSATSRRGLKSPPRVSSASPSSPKGRVGAVPAFGKGNPKTAAGDADRNKATDKSQLMYKAPCSKPLRLQVSLAKKTYRTYLVDPSSPEEGGRQWNENEGEGRSKNIMPLLGGGGVVGRASFASGTSSLGLFGGRASSVSSISTTRTNQKMKSAPPSSKEGTSGARGSATPNGRGAAAGGQRSRKRGAKGKDDADESFDEADEDGKMITEEVTTAQKSESGRRLFARLYNIRAYMQYVPQTAEDWSQALAREERHRRRRAEGLPSDTEEEDNEGEDNSSGGTDEEEEEENNEGLSEGNTDDQHHGDDDENSDEDTTTTNIKVLEGEWGAPSTGSKQGNARRRTSSRGINGAREESTFSPRSIALSSTATSSADATPRLRKRSGGKRRKDKGGEKAGGGVRNARDTTTKKNSPNREKRGSPPPKPSSAGPRSKSPNSPRHYKQVTNAEKLASLMRYLSPSNFAEAVSGKPLPPGVFISPFGVGGTPAKGTPRGRATPTAVEAEQGMPSTKATNATATPQSSQPTSPRGNSLRTQTTEAKNPDSSPNTLEGLQDALTAVSKGVLPFEERKSLRPAGTFVDGASVLPSQIAATPEGHSIIQHLNAALAAHRRQRGLFSFPTAEELSGVCTDGTTSFEFFLPSEGEYLLEIVVADLVQLSPGDEWKCVVLAASTFAPFFATVEEISGDEGRGEGDGSNPEDDDGDDEAGGGEENSADEVSGEA